MQGLNERRGTHWLNLEIDTINTEIKITKIDLLFGGVNDFIIACEQIAILWLGSRLVMDNAMTIGMFIAFGVFREQFADRIWSLTNFLMRLRMIHLHNERVSDIALNTREMKKPDRERINTMFATPMLSGQRIISHFITVRTPPLRLQDDKPVARSIFIV